jgi:hypothetical protein
MQDKAAQHSSWRREVAAKQGMEERENRKNVDRRRKQRERESMSIPSSSVVCSNTIN